MFDIKKFSVFSFVASMIFAAVILLSAHSAKSEPTWTQLSDKARDVGDGWMIGNTPVPGGYGIFRVDSFFDGGQWERMPGSAIRIGGRLEEPWVVNDRHEIFRWNGSGWTAMPGKARDVGDGWVIGFTPVPGGYGIFRWDNDRNDWQRMQGSAVRIGGSYDHPWVVNDRHEIFRWNGIKWVKMPGRGRDVGDSWVIGFTAVPGGYGIFRWDYHLNEWQRMQGSAVHISNYKCGRTTYIVNDRQEMFLGRVPCQ